jgi:hypothetical protein
MLDASLATIHENFIFICGGHRYKCSMPLARLLSPKICFLHSIDPSVTEYTIKTKDVNNQFPLFLSLVQGSRIHVDASHFQFLCSLSRELCNYDLFFSLMHHFQPNIPLSEIRNPSFLDLCDDLSIGSISARFYQLTPSQLDSIPLPNLFHVLCHNSLMVATEDTLCSYICSRHSDSLESLHLLQFVRFEYLSRESVNDLISVIPGYIDHCLWDAISRRLILWRKKFPLPDAKSLDGIISYLTKKHGGNVHDLGIVTVRAKSILHMYSERTIVDFHNRRDCQGILSEDKPGQWICWDFHDLRIRPTHYTLFSYGLRSWLVEGSVDGVNWTELDRQTEQDMYGMGLTSFPVGNPVECRLVRLTQIQIRLDGFFQLGVHWLEFFGDIIE